MTVTALDVAVFAAFYLTVVAFSLFKSRGRRTSADYFLGGRQLPWWLIGISIVAANISTEQFVGMSGQAAGDVGLAVSAWQLTGAVGIVIVAFFFLPRFLRSGIYTMPEYQEYRYRPLARAIMSFLTVVIYVTVTTAAVLFSGGTRRASSRSVRASPMRSCDCSCMILAWLSKDLARSGSLCSFAVYRTV
jgi:SSS family solute:Na+ symporter